MKSPVGRATPRLVHRVCARAAAHVPHRHRGGAAPPPARPQSTTHTGARGGRPGDRRALSAGLPADLLLDTLTKFPAATVAARPLVSKICAPHAARAAAPPAYVIEARAPAAGREAAGREAARAEAAGRQGAGAGPPPPRRRRCRCRRWRGPHRSPRRRRRTAPPRRRRRRFRRRTLAPTPVAPPSLGEAVAVVGDVKAEAGAVLASLAIERTLGAFPDAVAPELRRSASPRARACASSSTRPTTAPSARRCCG